MPFQELLPGKIDHYELWFSYLRLAKASADPKVQAALRQSEKFYRPWGDVLTVEFGPWWKENRWMFEDNDFVVEQMFSSDEMPRFTDMFAETIYLKIRLSRPPEVLAELAEKQIRLAMSFGTSGKSKTWIQPQSKYHLTKGAEIRADVLRERLIVYRDVVLAHPYLNGKALLTKVRDHFGEEKKWPYALRKDNDPADNRALRNLRRLIIETRKTVLNVARGEFPGTRT